MQYSYRTICNIQQTILKIEELKRLVGKYPQYLTDPDPIIKWPFMVPLMVTTSNNGMSASIKDLKSSIAKIRSNFRFLFALSLGVTIIMSVLLVASNNVYAQT
ncbi:MAG: hypothetical protein WAM14_18440, partial [Candidatus Nitrosopolaris sp.]